MNGEKLIQNNNKTFLEKHKGTQLYVCIKYIFTKIVHYNQVTMQMIFRIHTHMHTNAQMLWSRSDTGYLSLKMQIMITLLPHIEFTFRMM